jgi:hypothetical protein
MSQRILLLPFICCGGTRVVWNVTLPPDSLVNKTSAVYNLFLVYLSISTCFVQLWAHHQEKKLYLCDTWYLLFCVEDYLECRWNETHKHGCFSWWSAHSCLKHVETDKYKYIKKKLCTKLVLFTTLYRDARPTKHKIPPDILTTWQKTMILTFKRLKLICFIQGISPYCAVNTFHHGYKNQSVNDV